MARGRATKRIKFAEVPGQPDAGANLDTSVLLAEAQRLHKLLADDLLQRADSSAAVTRTLKARHSSEVRGKSTAAGYDEWRHRFCGQVASAWVLSCVFVRTLEDRGLLGQVRIAGEGAADSQRQFFALAPSLTERDYLLTVFRELSLLPAGAELFDARHNPVWLLAPSADGARALLEMFRMPNADTPALRFGQSDTRFLGDLYQDLDEDVRKRFALLQTPRFVESFILDRTLERAIDRFGLNDTTIIDPTCGSGHFLLGSFERLYEHRLRAEPGLDPRQAAEKALDSIAGADINPYAVGIARFRLTLAFLERTGFAKLADAPKLPLHLAVADSLLHNPHLPQRRFMDGEETSARAWGGEQFALDDEQAARDVLYKQYAAVVGNPPYITVKDPVLRGRYRELYASTAGKYSLSVPFMERFFQLARKGGFVGKITANSFMKREFGKKLIQDYLPTVNLDLIVNTSGAYIPGHGTPTVILFGTSDPPEGNEVRAVLAKRGELATPDDPEQGLVWRSIADHWSENGFENDYVSISPIQRSTLAQHPWTLGGGGANELKELLEERGEKTLGDISTIGVGGMSNADDVYIGSAGSWERLGVDDSWYKPLVIGEEIRDWSHETNLRVFFPYDADLNLSSPQGGAYRAIWPYRTVLWSRAVFSGGTYKTAGRPWYEWHQLTTDRYRTPLTIAFAEVASHNHFVLDRGGKVFKQTAPIIKLPESATEDDHLALLAYLSSSTACFWMKQVCHNKGYGADSANARTTSEEYDNFFQFNGTRLAHLPLLSDKSRIVGSGRIAEEVGGPTRIVGEIGLHIANMADERESFMPASVLDSWLKGDVSLNKWLEDSKRIAGSKLMRMCLLQEELDWLLYERFGLMSDEEIGRHRADATELNEGPGLSPGHRPFEVVLAREHAKKGTITDWIERNGYELPAEMDGRYPVEYQRKIDTRIAIIDSNPQIHLIEQPEYKHRWITRDWDRELQEAGRGILAGAGEKILDDETEILRAADMSRLVLGESKMTELADVVRDDDVDFVIWIGSLWLSNAVPFLTAHTYKPTGLEKRAAWEHTWDLQRREDAGEDVGDIPVPPKYASKDFAKPGYWRLRGKLDVPKERFISYPGCESDEDGEPVYGWAGWNHEQRALALGKLYFKRRSEEAWDKDRLTPMLAGLLELLPWVKQWHTEPRDDYGSESPASYFEKLLEGECHELGLTHDDLRAWRPPKKTRRGRGKKKAKG